MPAARVIYSVLFFVLSLLLIIVAKPKAFFHEDGSIRPFGTGRRRGTDAADKTTTTTVFPLGVVVVVLAVLSLYTFVMIDLIFAQ